MADSTILLKVEKWIREEALKQVYRKVFSKQKLSLQGNGEFEFDAVSEDGSIVALISTSGSMTRSGKPGVGKIHKIRSDALWLLMLKSKPEHLVLVFTNQTMFDQITKVQKIDRFPEEIELLYAPLTYELNKMVDDFYPGAADEVTPKKTEQ